MEPYCRGAYATPEVRCPACREGAHNRCTVTVIEDDQLALCGCRCGGHQATTANTRPATGAPRTLAVVVEGTPAPQGSKRHVGHGVMVEMSKRLEPWRDDVRQAARAALAGADWDRAARVLAVNITFTFARPRSHFRTGKHAHELREAAPVLVAVRPDLDKLTRSTLDALASAGAYVDDARVAQLWTRKEYVTLTSAEPGAFIELFDLSPFPAPVHTAPTLKERA